MREHEHSQFDAESMVVAWCSAGICCGARDPPSEEACVCMDGRVVDALACEADEGRGDAARCPGERLPRGDPGVPEWSNPAGVMPGDRPLNV